RHGEVPQQLENMAAGISPKDSIFVLKAHQIGIARIEKDGGGPIGRDIILVDLESHSCRVGVRRLRIVDGNNRRSPASVRGGNRIA
ncbi:MAG: hypothetical protein ABR976_22600, partial [Terracidiphilus sp.]